MAKRKLVGDSKYPGLVEGSVTNSFSTFSKKKRSDFDLKVPACLKWLPKENIGTGVIEAMFDYTQVVGEGSTGEVFEAKLKEGSRKFAIKRVSKKHSMAAAVFNTEATILYNLKNRGVIKLYNCAMDHKCYYLVTELGQTDLLKRVLSSPSNCLPESLAKTITRRLLRTIFWLHDQDLVHRDLKLENVVFTSDDPNYPKLIDFAQAVVLDKRKQKQKFAGLSSGTVYYLSPERMREHTGKELKKSEIWAVGVMVYEMMFGIRAFPGNSKHEVMKRIAACDYSIPKRKASELCVDFIKSTLVVDSSKRPSAYSALSHPWIAK